MVETGIVEIGNLLLESGVVLDQVHLAYEWAKNDHAPTVLVCHALTGNHKVIGTETKPGWWNGLVGDGKSVDTNEFSVISFNVLGGCDGSTGPLSINPKTNRPYRQTFPEITIRDMVHAERKALSFLGIDKLHTVIGGSLGGMRALEWGILYPDDMNLLLPLAVTPSLSAYGIAFNCIGLHAIESDDDFANGNYEDSADVKGFETARMAGMVTYRSSQLFNERFARDESNSGEYEVESYLHHIGKKITTHFDPNSYCTLLRAMNTHDIGRGRGGIREAAKQIKAKTVLMGFTHDLIYPPESIRTFAHQLTNSNFCLINTEFGHDGFLTEYNKWGLFIKQSMEVATCRQSKSLYLASVL
jgi:homoserine O-acetyltransferase/O-succinyltransferase